MIQLIKMLLNNRMASIPCANRHSYGYMKDIENVLRHDSNISNDYLRSSSPTAALQYFNMRVTQRLHRYRSLKRQWQEVASSIHYPCQSLVRLPSGNFPEINSSLHETPRSKFLKKQRKINETKSFTITDVLNPNSSTNKDDSDKNHIELDPLHTRIQQDLIKLRKFIKTKQRKSTDGSTMKTSIDRKYSDEMTILPNTFEEQENHPIPNGISQQNQQISSPKRLKPLDHVKIAGSQMRRPTLTKSESLNSPTMNHSNSSSICSHYSKLPLKVKLPITNSKTNETTSSQNNVSSIPTPIYRVVSSKKQSNRSNKFLPMTSASQRSPSRRPSIVLTSPPVLSEKRPSFTKQEILLPPLSRASNRDTSLFDYTYAASSSSAIPPSMILNRNNSLLPILLHSSCCIGIQTGKTSSLMTSECESQQDEETIVHENDNYYHLLSYKQMINGLPKPVISSDVHYGKDDYEILFDQLNHVRETMPNNNTYDDYARITI